MLLPDFELQCALRAEPASGTAAVALVGDSSGSRQGLVIQQFNPVARAAGVIAGMSLPQAQARCAQLLFLRRDPRQEVIVTSALIQAADRVSPYFEHTGPGCCTLDLSRTGEIDHQSWASDLVRELHHLDLTARVGVAPTPDAALQAARIATPILVTTDALQNVAELPVMVLEPSEHLLDVLGDWGIYQVADLRRLDRQQVAERLGTEGLELWDRAGGGCSRPLRLVRATGTYEEGVEFEGAVETLEPLLFRLRRCLEQLCRRLRANLLLAGGLELVLESDDRSTLARTIQIPAPTSEEDVLFRILSTYLDTVQTESCISGFRLRAYPSSPRDHQAHLWDNSLKDPNGFAQTLAQLGAIVGSDHVGVPHRLLTHRPDRFSLESPAFDDATACIRHKPSSLAEPASLPPLGLSLRRYRPPFRVNVAASDRSLLHVSGRKVDDRIHACQGPWRLDGQWWDRQAAWCWEEWDVQLGRGGLYRLANHRQAHWWMLGFYD
ncbi:MAG: DNA polymerase Y family protein [Rhodospirillales bacterium]|nr:DNA polymerase Y family protein [Acetobacter sp.]